MGHSFKALSPLDVQDISTRSHEAQTFVETQQSKKRWWIVSSSPQNRHVLSAIFFLLDKLSLVSNLLLLSSHKKVCTLGGILSPQIAGEWTGLTPLKLTTAYRDCTEYTPEEFRLQMNSSPSLEKEIELAMLQISYQRDMSWLDTVLLKVNFKSVPFHASATVMPFSFTILYRGQNWIARLELPNHWCSQNLTVLPSPIFQEYPNLAALHAQSTPFQKSEVSSSG